MDDCCYGIYGYNPSKREDNQTYSSYFANCVTAYDQLSTPNHDPHHLPPKSYKIRLKPYMNISGGVGTNADPYVLKNKCKT